MAPLKRAEQLLEAMATRREERIGRGDIGEWQTELNEVRRALCAIVEHLADADKPPNPRITEL